MNIDNLFPTPIGMDKLPKKLTAAQLRFLTTQQMQNNADNLRSQNSYILDSKELLDLRNELLKIVRKYFTIVHAPANDVDVYITQSWVNFTQPGEHHQLHTHSNSFISGVFYIHSEGETDKIMFHKNTHEFIQFTAPTTWNAYNSRSWWYPVNTGDVILFPSNLAHEVPATTSSSNRISLAFNVFLKGRLGDYEKLNELKLT
jgi:uncharacterized protein (TIGR02466 family)